MIQPDPNRHPGLQLAQIFLRHAHFEHAVEPLGIPPVAITQATISISFNVTELTTDSGKQAMSVLLRARSTPGFDHPYRIDVVMQGILEPIEGEENFPLADYARVAGATLLFPFLREVVANITGRGRVGALWLKPFNVQFAAGHPDSLDVDSPPVVAAES
ncbi:MAG: protein-export chaperone SecB [Gemmatimonadota bacterium]|nr:protein-export chaperone SecB [Gemmatimonadota bacterium]